MKQINQGANKGFGRAWDDKFIQIAEALAEEGFTNAQLGKAFKVTEKTILKWQLERPEFAEALKIGKEAADTRVIQSLYKRACGYEHDEVDIRTVAIGGGVSQVVKTPFKKIYPPDVTACIFWLKNRQRDNWRDRHEISQTAPDGSALAPIQVIITGGEPPEKRLNDKSAIDVTPE